MVYNYHLGISNDEIINEMNKDFLDTSDSLSREMSHTSNQLICVIGDRVISEADSGFFEFETTRIYLSITAYHSVHIKCFIFQLRKHLKQTSKKLSKGLLELIKHW